MADLSTPLRQAIQAAKGQAPPEDDFRAPEDVDDVMPCEWFALCARPATTTEPHPILGEVPICAQCAALVEACS